jgi:secreted PhoX family phosphatase
VLGTLNNCASGMTPWGTYLAGEENFRFYFSAGDTPTPHQTRWALSKKSPYRWDEFDARWDAQKHPNEHNRFGWIVEIDPMDPTSMPTKRTAIGRGAHEGAWVAVTNDNRAVVYSGEDARFEYIYKFVSRDTIKPAGGGVTMAQTNSTLLDHGTLYVARFDTNGTGAWLPLVQGQGGLTAAAGFADQGEVLIKARQASDVLGGTKMDRPEWLSIDAASKTVYCTLTNNSARGVGKNPAVDAANPRANNTMGNIIQWQEGKDFDATAFTWTHFVMAGDSANARAETKGNIKGDLFGCPDGIIISPNGMLWVQTDAFATELNKGDFKNFGNNQMLAYDPKTGAFKRFLAGPVNCEITGLAFTPDGTTMFVNVQHPGESAGEQSDPKNPMKFSNWPDGKAAQRPRSATVIVRRNDGGVVGA